MVKNPPANARTAEDAALTPGWGRSPAGGNGNPAEETEVYELFLGSHN